MIEITRTNYKWFTYNIFITGYSMQLSGKREIRSSELKPYICVSAFIRVLDVITTLFLIIITL